MRNATATYSFLTSTDGVDAVGEEEEEEEEEGTSPFRVLSGAEEEEVARVFVYRESGPMLVFPSSSRQTLAIGEPRPSDLPPNIDLFLWGGLATTVQEAIAPKLQKHLRTVAWCFFVGYVVAMTPFVGISMSEKWTTQVFGAYMLYAMLCLVGTTRACRIFTHSLVLSLHEDLENAILELATHFHKVGYDLQYGTQRTGPWSLDAFVRIIHWNPNLEHSTEQGPHLGFTVLPPQTRYSPQSQTETVLLSRQGGPGGRSATFPPGHGQYPTPQSGPVLPCWNSRRYFRVAVYGPRINAPITRFQRKEHNFGSLVRDSEIQELVDKFTWGAVATEMRRLTVEYRRLRSPVVLLFFVLVMVLPHVPSSVLPNDRLLVVLITIGLYLIITMLTGPSLERIVPERVLGQAKFFELHRKFEEKIQELSPLVAERSGYTLDYQIESDGCGSTSGYVCFRPLEDDATTVDHTVLPVPFSTSFGEV